MNSPIYYRLIINYDDKVTIACMQEFDEYDYDQSRFIKDENGDAYKFYSEKDAISELNKLIKPDMIDPEYISHQSQRDIYFK